MSTTLFFIDKILANARSLLVILHDNPDPDALAAGFALKTLAEIRCHVPTTITYGGLINRAENKSMVKELEIPAIRFDTVALEQFDRIAMVDTQPGRGNNPLPETAHCHLVFDHHALEKPQDVDLLVYNRNIGATATLLCELLFAADIEIKSNLATAIIYAIRTETQELRREAHKRDIQVYLTLYPISSLRKIGAIAFPKLPDSYFEMLFVALQRALIYRQFIFVPLAQVPAPEIIAEMADLFLRRTYVTWVLVMGQYENSIYFSLRTTHSEGQAFRILQQILEDCVNAGGHETFAGGRVDLNENYEFQQLQQKTLARYAAIFGHQDAVWRHLIQADESVRSILLQPKPDALPKE
ncbi:MAG: hypothetical protein EHM72_10670 [Calditrichaeota bacterium]|nr:MAG: hypothetical protein EHM72_10670 [Calditrichota bacterium]